MSQKIIYNILKDDLGGSGERKDIINIVRQKYNLLGMSDQSITNKLTRLRKWGCVGYITHEKLWFIKGEFEYNNYNIK